MATSKTPIRVAVAANFAPILEQILPQFTQKHGIAVQIISGSTGTLFLQIKHGAPFDIFLSADSVRPQALVEQGLTAKNSLQTYALGQLALWSNTQTVSINTLAKIIDKQRFAIANPDTAPYGKAAKEVLLSLNLWQQVRGQLVTGININQTFQQIRSQAVPVGIVANSQLVLNQLNGTVIPHHLYQPIQQQLVILKSSRQINQAQKLSQFLLSRPIQKQIQDYGYQAITTSHVEPAI